MVFSIRNSHFISFNNFSWYFCSIFNQRFKHFMELAFSNSILGKTFASMNSTNPRTTPWNFHKKILRIGDFEKWPFFESAILNFIFSRNSFFFFFASSLWKLVTNYLLEWIGLNFHDYDGLQQKMTHTKHALAQPIP